MILYKSLEDISEKFQGNTFFNMNINLQLKIKINKKRHSPGIKTLKDA